jgi:esterase/lipase
MVMSHVPQPECRATAMNGFWRCLPELHVCWHRVTLDALECMNRWACRSQQISGNSAGGQMIVIASCHCPVPEFVQMASESSLAATDLV